MTGSLTVLLLAGLHGATVEAADGTAPGAALLPRAAAVAQALRDQGVQPDEPVHLRVGARAADIAALLGVWQAGAVAVPIHASANALTAQRLREATGARFLVDGDGVATIGEAPPPARDLLRGAALVVFTSGTTGRPKGVVLRHDALAGKLDVLSRMLPIGPTDVVLLPLQLTFIFGLWASLLTIKAHARLVLVGRFSAEAIAPALRRATVAAMVPSMLRTILAGAPPPAPAMHMLLTGGEPLGPALARDIGAAWAGARIHDLYGSTETGSCDIARIAVASDASGRVGHPTEGVAVRIAGDGELLVRTPHGMAGYLDQPELTQAAYSEGWFRTGDLARIEPGGAVVLIGRSKEMISRGGNKVAPQEVDDALAAHPAVMACLSTGMPDVRLGETIHAAVVLRDTAASPEALREWLAARLERYKLPDAIHVVVALPAGPTGKASRAALRALLQPALNAIDTPFMQ